MEKYVCKAPLVPRALLFSGQFDFRFAQKHYIMNDAVEASIYEMTTLYYTKINSHFLSTLYLVFLNKSNKKANIRGLKSRVLWPTINP